MGRRRGLFGRLFRGRGPAVGGDPADDRTSAGAGPVWGGEYVPPAQDALPGDILTYSSSGSVPAGTRHAKPPKFLKGKTAPRFVYDWRADDALRRALGDLIDARGVDNLLDCCAWHRGHVPSRLWKAECARLLAKSPDSPKALRAIAEREEQVPRSASRPCVDFVCGAVWALSLTGADESVPLLIRIADQNGRAGLGQQRASLALAAIRALGSVGGELAVPALRRLEAEAPLALIRRAASKALKSALATWGLSRAEVPEWQASTFELNSRGERLMPLARGYSAGVQLNTDGTLHVVYRDPSGRSLAGRPSADGLADDLARLGRFLKDLRVVVRAERTRLQLLLADHRELPAGEWISRYLDHPITGTFSRALIWEYTEDAGDHWDARLPHRVDEDGSWRLATVEGTLREIDPAGRIRLMRPLRTTSQESRYWRKRLKAAGLRQAVNQLDLP